MKCKVCNSETKQLFKSLVLNKYEVDYFRCPNCDFIQTEKPYWLEEAYGNAITNLDVGLVSRNINFSNLIEKIIKNNFDYNTKFLDYAGGYGLFVRLMRDKGFDFYREDKYCENIFAQYYDLDDMKSENKFEAVTALEVFEHLEDPLEEIKKMFKFSDILIFSTELQPNKEIKNSDDWWYFTPETGQHIAFYSEKTLRHVAEKLHYTFYTNGNLHLLSTRKFKNNPLLNNDSSGNENKDEMKSLIQSDFDFAKNIILKVNAIKNESINQKENKDENSWKEVFVHKLSVAFAQLDSTKTQLGSVRTQLDSTKTQLDSTKTQLDSTKTQLDSTKTQLDSTKTQLAGMYASREWKAGIILQKMVKILIPKDSLRRKMTLLLFRIINSSLKCCKLLFKEIATVIYNFSEFLIQQKINSNSFGEKEKLLIDCSFVYKHPEINTGIQRVVKNILKNINTSKDAHNVKIIPIILIGNYLVEINPQKRADFLFAKFENDFFLVRISKKILRQIRTYFFIYNNIVVVNGGDIFLMADSNWDHDISEVINYIKKRGGQLILIAYDLIPANHPQFCDDSTVVIFNNFFSKFATRLDGFISISKTVMNDLMEYFSALGVDVSKHYFDYFVLGSDFKKQEYASDNVRKEIVDLYKDKSVYLTVSTIEPRKNQSYLVDSFEKLWENGVNVKLCIIGRVGWKVEDLIERIKCHKEYNKRLFMFNDATDAELSYCYNKAKMLVFASFVEGFGLPIVESLNNGLPVLASDIPIHREVGEDAIEYFDFNNIEDLVNKIEYIEKNGISQKVKVTSIKTKTWCESSTELFSKVMQISDKISRDRSKK